MSSAVKKWLFLGGWICAGLAAALVVTVAAKHMDTLHPVGHTGLNSVLPATDASSRRGRVIEIDVLRLRTLLQLDPNLYLVDVRNASELDGPLGRIPQAVHIQLQNCGFYLHCRRAQHEGRSGSGFPGPRGLFR
ncbi:MAG: hypothetical protein P8X68_13560 [Desulfobacterales bacterium]